MTDYFSILDQPRRPWLEEAPLKESFQRLAAIQHPDKAGTGDAARFAVLNSAYSTLKEPALRLRHLLELESEPLPSTAQIPPALAQVFMELAGARGKLDRFLAKQSGASSPLGKAMVAIEKNALQESWELMARRIRTAKESATERLMQLDADWHGPEPVRETLVALHQEFAYLARWETQLREALLSLAL
ncbi:MAG: hscB [Chthoniobacteraceae bacterium]|nr:hscB [Chthoniobacteraceae bacterium]